MVVVVQQFWVLVDQDSVRPFIYLYYLPFLMWGFYGSFFAYPIALIETVMGHWLYDIWVWTPVPATVLAMTGLAMRHGGMPLTEMNRTLLREDWIGLNLQFGGHACMFAVLLVFEITGIIGAYWGQPVISVFLIASYTIGCGLLALQCWRKLQRGKQLRRQTA